MSTAATKSPLTTPSAIKIDLTGINGNGSGRNGGGPDNNGHQGNEDERGDHSPSLYQIGMWVAIASIFMLFMALTGTYIMLVSGSNTWQSIKMPKMLWASTAIIFISSISVERARRSLNHYNENQYLRWLYVTLGLGLGFISLQIVVWQRLAEQGIYAATNQHRFFFYLLTGVHGLHLLGGTLALVYLILRTYYRRLDKREEIKRQAVSKAVSTYWHFMGILWIYIFLLLFFWK
jgi:cytochrome c oxidase subunit III